MARLDLSSKYLLDTTTDSCHGCVPPTSGVCALQTEDGINRPTELRMRFSTMCHCKKKVLLLFGSSHVVRMAKWFPNRTVKRLPATFDAVYFEGKSGLHASDVTRGQVRRIISKIRSFYPGCFITVLTILGGNDAYSEPSKWRVVDNLVTLAHLFLEEGARQIMVYPLMNRYWRPKTRFPLPDWYNDHVTSINRRLRNKALTIKGLLVPRPIEFIDGIDIKDGVHLAEDRHGVGIDKLWFSILLADHLFW